jgi:hypothetical protein
MVIYETKAVQFDSSKEGTLSRNNIQDHGRTSRTEDLARNTTNRSVDVRIRGRRRWSETETKEAVAMNLGGSEFEASSSSLANRSACSRPPLRLLHTRPGPARTPPSDGRSAAASLEKIALPQTRREGEKSSEKFLVCGAGGFFREKQARGNAQ